MIAVGVDTGALDEMLEKISDFYDAEVEATVEALTSLIEPLLIVVMGVTVGGMVIALYMPMFSIISKMSGDGGEVEVSSGPAHQLATRIEGLVDDGRAGSDDEVTGRLVGGSRVRV